MNESYQPWTQDQAYRLPRSLRDRRPEDHLRGASFRRVQALAESIGMPIQDLNRVCE